MIVDCFSKRTEMFKGHFRVLYILKKFKLINNTLALYLLC